MVRKGLSGKVTSEEIEGKCRIKFMAIRSKSVLGRENRMCKGPGVEAGLLSSGAGKAGESLAEGASGKTVESENREVVAGSCRALGAMVRLN